MRNELERRVYVSGHEHPFVFQAQRDANGNYVPISDDVIKAAVAAVNPNIDTNTQIAWNLTRDINGEEYYKAQFLPRAQNKGC